jgi:hypothetical protein
MRCGPVEMVTSVNGIGVSGQSLGVQKLLLGRAAIGVALVHDPDVGKYRCYRAAHERPNHRGVAAIETSRVPLRI